MSTTTDAAPPAVLHARRSSGRLTPGQALHWCWPHPGEAGRPTVTGFSYGTDEALWWRLAGDGRTHGPDAPVDLAQAYELVAFDGTQELRWLHEADGLGAAVVVTEDAARLPTDGVPATDPDVPQTRRQPRRVRDFQHVLADHVEVRDTAWATLRARRYRTALVPVEQSTATGPVDAETVVLLAGVEYAAEDEHGNLTVVDQRFTGLRYAHTRPHVPRPARHHEHCEGGEG